MPAPPDEETVAEPVVRNWRAASRWAHALFWASLGFAGFALLMLIVSFIG